MSIFNPKYGAALYIEGFRMWKRDWKGLETRNSNFESPLTKNKGVILFYGTVFVKFESPVLCRRPAGP